MPNVHEQQKLVQKWRHICFKAVDLELTYVADNVSLTIELPREVMFQGANPVDAKVMIEDKFQGAYVCAPSVVTEPQFGTLQFIGNGWVYTPSDPGYVIDDSFTYVVEANYLTSNEATVTIIGTSKPKE